MEEQNSISQYVVIDGVNVFNGNKNCAILRPAEADTGIVFKVKQEIIPATFDYAYAHRPLRSLRQASCISLRGHSETALKVEHMLSAIYALGIDNLMIELSDGVCPRQNDSVSGIVAQLESLVISTGARRRYLEIDSPASEDDCVVTKDTGDRLSVSRSDGVKISYHASYDYVSVGDQQKTVRLDLDSYKQEIMHARGIFFLPFGSRFLIDSFLGSYHGITDRNALLIGSSDCPRYLNNSGSSGPYGKDEFVRHKILDVIGAIALSGTRYKNTLFDFSLTGHSFDIYALKTLHERGVFRESAICAVDAKHI